MKGNDLACFGFDQWKARSWCCPKSLSKGPLCDWWHAVKITDRNIEITPADLFLQYTEQMRFLALKSKQALIKTESQTLIHASCKPGGMGQMTGTVELIGVYGDNKCNISAVTLGFMGPVLAA